MKYRFTSIICLNCRISLKMRWHQNFSLVLITSFTVSLPMLFLIKIAPYVPDNLYTKYMFSTKYKINIFVLLLHFHLCHNIFQQNTWIFTWFSYFHDVIHFFIQNYCLIANEPKTFFWITASVTDEWFEKILGSLQSCRPVNNNLCGY